VVAKKCPRSLSRTNFHNHALSRTNFRPRARAGQFPPKPVSSLHCRRLTPPRPHFTRRRSSLSRRLCLHNNDRTAVFAEPSTGASPPPPPATPLPLSLSLSLSLSLVEDDKHCSHLSIAVAGQPATTGYHYRPQHQGAFFHFVPIRRCGSELSWVDCR
jgi:hypothetical protein